MTDYAQYKLKDVNIPKLLAFGFKREDEDTLIYVFPAHKYRRFVTLDCKISINTDDGAVNVDLYNSDGSTYAPFYNGEYGNFSILFQKINRRILAEFKKIGIIRGKLNEHDYHKRMRKVHKRNCGRQ